MSTKKRNLRHLILKKINENNEVSVNELMYFLPIEFEFKKVADCCYQAKREGLLSSRMDALEKKPAYKITPAGIERLKELDEQQTQDPDPIDSIGNPESPDLSQEIASLKKLLEDSEERAEKLSAGLEEAHSFGMEAKEAFEEIERELIEVSADFEAKEYELKALYNAFDAIKAGSDLLIAENSELKNGKIYPVAKVKKYLVANKNAEIIFNSTLKSAKESAKKIAVKSGGFSEVYAMISVGRSFRGAVWEDQK